jgi:hypothetical protein
MTMPFDYLCTIHLRQQNVLCLSFNNNIAYYYLQNDKTSKDKR